MTERELLDSLPFSTQCPSDEVDLVRYLYENKLKKVSDLRQYCDYVD